MVDIPLSDEPALDADLDAAPDIDIGDFDGIAEDALSGLFVGDEDGDGEMEIY